MYIYFAKAYCIQYAACELSVRCAQTKAITTISRVVERRAKKNRINIWKQQRMNAAAHKTIWKIFSFIISTTATHHMREPNNANDYALLA